MGVPDALARAKYVSLTTYRRDGRAVPTAVWHAVDGDELMILSAPEAGKVKRIRNGARVTVTPCDVRGKIREGAPTFDGTARLLPTPAQARQALERRYLMVRIANTFDRLRRRDRPGVGIAVRV